MLFNTRDQFILIEEYLVAKLKFFGFNNPDLKRVTIWVTMYTCVYCREQQLFVTDAKDFKFEN